MPRLAETDGPAVGRCTAATPRASSMSTALPAKGRSTTTMAPDSCSSRKSVTAQQLNGVASRRWIVRRRFGVTPYHAEARRVDGHPVLHTGMRMADVVHRERARESLLLTLEVHAEVDRLLGEFEADHWP